MANANGDPLDGNRPRTDYNGFGEMSDVCIKRKIRNRMQDMGKSIFVQSDDRSDDGYDSLSARANAKLSKIKNREEYAHIACETWLDVRSFGQVFGFKPPKEKEESKSKKEEKPKATKEKGVSIGVRGPVSIHQAVSVSPVEIHSLQITKSVNGNPAEGRSPDTMGMKHMVRFGLYRVKGSINVQLAQKTGFSEEDAKIIKECLRTLFENDASAARPEGFMEVKRLYWWEHDCPAGQYSSAKVHNTLKVELKPGVEIPADVKDYAITLEELPGLTCEVVEGI